MIQVVRALMRVKPGFVCLPHCLVKLVKFRIGIIVISDDFYV